MLHTALFISPQNTNEATKLVHSASFSLDWTILLSMQLKWKIFVVNLSRRRRLCDREAEPTLQEGRKWMASFRWLSGRWRRALQEVNKHVYERWTSAQEVTVSRVLDELDQGNDSLYTYTAVRLKWNGAICMFSKIIMSNQGLILARITHLPIQSIIAARRVRRHGHLETFQKSSLLKTRFWLFW